MVLLDLDNLLNVFTGLLVFELDYIVKVVWESEIDVLFVVYVHDKAMNIERLDWELLYDIDDNRFKNKLDVNKVKMYNIKVIYIKY